MAKRQTRLPDCFEYSIICTLLAMQDRASQSRTAIFTDIDDTFIARNHDTKAMADAQRLRALADERRWPIVVISGAEFSDIHQRISDGEIPTAAVVISSVGTAIWVSQTDGAFVRDQQYDHMMQQTGYDRLVVAAKVRALLAKLPSTLRIQLQNSKQEEKLLARPDSTYWPYKVSLHYLTTPANAPAIAARFAKEFPGLRVLYCEEINYNARLKPATKERLYCLDIVPATKADAVNYLITKLGIVAGFKAGDSGNDTEMLLNPDPLTPILVGGYKPEAFAEITQHITTPAVGPMHTLDNGKDIYIETNTKTRAASSLLRAITMLLKKRL